MRVGKLSLLDVGKRLVAQVNSDDVFGLAAELAYRFFLAMFPFLIFLTALASFVATTFSVRDPSQQIVDLLARLMPPEATELIRPQIERTISTNQGGLMSFGILLTLWVAAGGFNAVIKAMNRAYDVEESRPFWKKYLLALGMTLLAGTFIVGAFVLLVVGQVFGRQIAEALGLGGTYQAVVGLARWPAVVALLVVATAFIYWAAPNMDLPWKWITPGSVLFVVGWLVATALFTFYVSNFGSYAATYGALAGVVVLLLWFYLTGIILLVGAELNAIVDQAMEPEKVERKRGEKRREANSG
ncbi:MAG: YihY/virulence factor BrkB family protein [Chloroflexota bacterium]|nr:YihY/virulence factor BrkB family protein [Chloroflexota bacterium]